MPVETNSDAETICDECAQPVSKRDEKFCADCEQCPLRTVKPWAMNSCLALTIIVIVCVVMVTVIVVALRWADAQ